MTALFNKHGDTASFRQGQNFYLASPLSKQRRMRARDNYRVVARQTPSRSVYIPVVDKDTSKELRTSYIYNLRQVDLPTDFANTLRQLEVLEDNWDGEGSPAPSHLAIDQADRFLHLIDRLTLGRADQTVKRITASVEGSIVIYFQEGKHLQLVEFFSDGDAYFVMRNPGTEPTIEPLRLETSHLQFAPDLLELNVQH